MIDNEQQYDYGCIIDLDIACGLLLVCVWGAAFIAGFVWELMR